MKTADVRLKTDDELKDQLLQIAKEQYNLRFQKSSGQLENTARVRVLRRTAAKIKTVQGERTRGVTIKAKAAAPAKKAVVASSRKKKAE